MTQAVQSDGSRRSRGLAAAGAAVVLAVGLVAASLALGPAAPAAGMNVDVDVVGIVPKTWTDEQGRQYLLTAMPIADGSDVLQPIIARDTITGDPDASWGSYRGRPGAKAVDLEPPGPGLVLARELAVTDDGRISAIWSPTGCGPCDRWFTRYASDGTPLAAPVLVEDISLQLAVLPDGSFLVTMPTSQVRWLGPLGEDRGLIPDVYTHQVAGATVDHLGRLVLATNEAKVLVWPPGGPVAATVPLPCGTGLPSTVGTGPTGFVAACIQTDAGAEWHLIVRRFDDAASPVWTSTGTDPDLDITTPHVAVVDGTGRAWVGGISDRTSNTAQAHSVVAAFDPSGPLHVGSTRALAHSDGSADYAAWVTDIRRVGADHVAFAENEWCCRIPSGELDFDDSAIGEVLPFRPGRPRCWAGVPTLLGAPAGSIRATFLPCLPTSPELAPTGYHLTVTTAAGTATADVAADGQDALEATVPSVPGGVRAVVTVKAFNQYGDAKGSSDPAVTITPFISALDFALRQRQDLTDTVPDLTATVAHLADGTTEPEAYVAGLLDTGRAHLVIEPVARLYRAYYLRDPDKGGLGYWVRKRSSGTKLSAISDAFARSTEFARRYGSLSNRAFVAKLYQNVFGRTGDSAGITFWAARLDQHRNTRGQVVLQFSESSEGIRRSAGVVQPLATAYLMLDRLPTTAERATWAAFSSFHRETAAAIMASEEYAEHVH